jgi:exopolyphosphatase/guanosine-5'-triphosphate,3'-diphosphate pyrophosphatase
VRIAVVDIGTNSTRLLIADVEDGRVTEVLRESIVTRLGEGVDSTGRLGDEPMERVFRALNHYAQEIRGHAVDARTAVMTSAVRDAANGAEFEAIVAKRYGLEGRTISGDDEARLTFRGATAARDPSDTTPLIVVDIGGGSTEIVAGRAGEVDFHVSTQVGVVRHTERHISSDPPTAEEIAALAEDARSVFEAEIPQDVRERTRAAIAVAGTATSAAAIDIGEFDQLRVEGRRLDTATLRAMLDRLASVGLAGRRATPGLHPDRAPTIVAGLTILLEILDLFGLDEVEISDRDILWGVALETAENLER